MLLQPLLCSTKIQKIEKKGTVDPSNANGLVVGFALLPASLDFISQCFFRLAFVSLSNRGLLLKGTRPSDESELSASVCSVIHANTLKVYKNYHHQWTEPCCSTFLLRGQEKRTCILGALRPR